MCVHKGGTFQIPTTIPKKYVEDAEECVRTSYGHAETFTSVSTV